MPAATDERTLRVVFANQHRDFHCCCGDVHSSPLVVRVLPTSPSLGSRQPTMTSGALCCAILYSTHPAALTFCFCQSPTVTEFQIQLGGSSLNWRLAFASQHSSCPLGSARGCGPGSDIISSHERKNKPFKCSDGRHSPPQRRRPAVRVEQGESFKFYAPSRSHWLIISAHLWSPSQTSLSVCRPELERRSVETTVTFLC